MIAAKARIAFKTPMSYLSPLRLHFFGKFLAAPPTANNDPMHYNLATFKEEYREREPSGAQKKGWWNPAGNADWHFLGCTVTSAFNADGEAVESDDPVLGMAIADSDQRVAAKICDLDPEQQLVSQIWGLEVRICSASGTTLLRGRFEPAAFMDIWDRAPDVPGDGRAGVWYQSVIQNLQWSDVSKSQFLSALREASTATGMLSIRFNLDLYDMDFKSPTFTQGRIAGTIGPAATDEPYHFVLGRQFMTTGTQENFFSPQNGVNFCVARVDNATRKILLDVGNALTVKPNGTFNDVGRLILQCNSAGSNPVVIGEIPYLTSNWYRDTAGVVALPANRTLTEVDLETISNNPLELTLTPSFPLVIPGYGRVTSKPTFVAIAEPKSGLFVRADQYVYRLDAGDNAHIRVYATLFGAPRARSTITFTLDTSQLQSGAGLPPVGTPPTALKFPMISIADERGCATIEIMSTDPGVPRSYIDGQLYGIRPNLPEIESYPVNPWNFISVLLWSAFTHDTPITWHGSIQPIFQLFRNLYPAMDRFLDLSSYDDICAHRELLVLALSLDMNNPNSMPVTRELSRAKRTAILRWLEDVGPDGKPLLGSPSPAVTASRKADLPPLDFAKRFTEAMRGGKEAAVARRIANGNTALAKAEGL
jgi:hypothetical protein